MRLAYVSLVLLVASGAQATHGPAPAVRLSHSPSEYAIATEPLGAMLESDYFRAPPQHFTTGAGCRIYLRPEDRDRLLAGCR
jgi:hypothetical protein